jgi:recombinational DNA repair ATPase RecF
MTRRLQALRVGNFKAFADTQRIPLKPITLIFGPNSAGKSSFIHSLALAHEAQFGREKRSLSRLDVHHTDVGGSAIDLGGFRQYVHRGQLNRRVEWGAELKVSALAAAKDQRLAQLLASIETV